MKVNVKIYHHAIESIKDKARQSLVETADAVKSDLVQSQIMPFDTGALQNRSTFVDDSDFKKDVVRIVSDTPYARRLYFHPEYNYQKTHNTNAGGQWFQPYIDGNKREFAQNAFARIMKGKL